MNNQPKAEAKQNNSNISDDLEELEEDSSYEKTNQIYSLNSQVNQLRKDKQKLLIDLEAKIKAHKTLQNKYDRLVAQANERKVENSNLIATVNRLEHENEELKNIIETHGGHLENANRRTADFHRSIEEFKDSGLGDPRDLIDQLLAKDNQIEKLKQAIIQLEGKPRQVEINSPLFEQKEEVSTLKQKIEELRKKQIAYKKQYESMLQGKEEIIKKIMSQNDDSFKKTIESKDKKIAELNKEVDEAKRRKQEISRELKDLTDKVSKYEQIIAKHKNELSKKQEQLKYSFELQKENIIKNLQQKNKKTLIQKQQKYSATEVSLATAENQLLINRQQISKLKIELASVGQYNTYLEGANKELEEGKKKMQASLYNKEEELIQVKDKCFMEISEVKRKMMEQRRAIEAKLYQVEEELLAKNFLIDKHERLLEEKKGKTVAENINSENALLEEVYQLKSEKQRLQRQVSQLEQANKIKTQTYIQLQKTLRQTYEERIQSLQAQKQLLSTQNIKQKQQMISQSSDVKETLDEKFHKLQMVCELLQIDKQQKNKQHKQLMLAKAKLQEKVKDLQQKKLACQNKIKECKEDYTALEVMYEELNEKYKTGVKDLEKEIQNMSVKIDDERRRAEKRKSQGNRAAIADKAQLDRANDKIQQLEKEVSELKNKQERQHLQNESLKEQVSRVNRQLSVTQRQRETLHRSHTRALSQTQHTYQHQKNTLLQYIQQLEQNISILNTKLSLSANKEENLLNTLSQLDRELKSIKVEYSVSLEQIKQLLNKCKQLEQLNKQAISHREAIKHNYEVNCQLFEESCRQKIQQELDSAYDQINKLNKVLMSKQEQLSKSRLAYQAPSSQHNLQITSVGSKHYIGQPPYPPSVPGSRMYLVPNAKDNAIYNPTAYESHSPLVSQHATQPANSYKVRVNRIS